MMFKVATSQDLIVDEVRAERRRQDEIFGIQDHTPEGWLPILGEEFGEVCKAIYESSNYREELVQVAAVAIAMIEAWDRQAVRSLYKQPEE